VAPFSFPTELNHKPLKPLFLGQALSPSRKHTENQSMAHKTFISYKYSEAQNVRNAILKSLGEDAIYYQGESDWG